MKVSTAPKPHLTVLLLCIIFLLSSIPPLRAQPGTGTSEATRDVFRIDELFACDADQPDVTALPDGGFAVVWTSEGRDIALRRYRANLQPTGPGQLVTDGSPTPDAVIGDVAVAATADGTVAVVWTDDRAELQARVFDSLGAPLTGVLSLAAGGPDPELDLAALPDGSFLVVWQRKIPGGTTLEALRFDRTGEEVRGFEVVRVRDLGADERARQPSVAVLGDDRLVFAWNHRLFGFPFPFTIVRHRIFTFDGQLLVDDTSIGVDGSVPAVDARSGGFVQLWRYNGSIVARGFDDEGRALGSKIPLRPMGEVEVSAPDLAFSSGLGHAVWEERSHAMPPTAPAPPGRIRLRRLTRDGSPFGPAETVDFGPGSVGSRGAPRIAGLAGGGVVVVGRHALPVGPADPVPCDAENGILAKVVPDDDLVLADRFRVRVEWHDRASGDQGLGVPGPRTPDTGSVWFFEPDNLELIVKIVDGRSVNGHFWFFYGALSNVGYRITVTDLVTGQEREYENPQGRLASFGDVTAFHEFAAFPPSAAPPPGVLFLPAEPSAQIDSAAGPCSPPELPVVPRPGLCLADRRFEVEVEWFDPRSDLAGVGHPIEINDVTGAFWFFRPSNVELVVKVLDGRPVNGRFWVLYGSLTDVAFTLRVRHSETLDQVEFENAPFEMSSGADTSSLTPPECNCPLAPPVPVCGLDGVSYPDACHALCVGWVGVDHAGPCEEGSP